MVTTYRFSMIELPELDVQVGCDVEFVQTVAMGATQRLGDASYEVEVEATGDGIAVTASGNVVTVRHAGAGGFSIGGIVAGDIVGGMSVVNGRVISGGRSISVSGDNITISGGGGRVIVNGKQVDLDGAPDAPPPPRVRIVAPRGSVLEGTFKDQARVSGDLTFGSAYVALSGSAEATVAVDGPLNAQVSSNGRLSASANGAVRVTASSSGQARISGQFESVEATASSSASIQTAGRCLGDYTATASSSASVSHSGAMNGRVRQRESSMGRVRVG